MYALAQIADFRYGKGSVFAADPWRALPKIDDPVLAAVHQRTEQYRPHQAEDRDVHANAQCQCQDDGGRQALHSGNRTKCESEFLEERHAIPQTVN